MSKQPALAGKIFVHSGEVIGKGLLFQILKDCEITRENLLKQL